MWDFLTLTKKRHFGISTFEVRFYSNFKILEWNKFSLIYISSDYLLPTADVKSADKEKYDDEYFAVV